jgi:hypothetical protein
MKKSVYLIEDFKPHDVGIISLHVTDLEWYRRTIHYKAKWTQYLTVVRVYNIFILLNGVRL